ncbi:hypothetical protein Tco_1441236 [Tanacetum coccineum]
MIPTTTLYSKADVDIDGCEGSMGYYPKVFSYRETLPVIELLLACGISNPLILFVCHCGVADMSSTAFIEPLHVIEFVTLLLNRDTSATPLCDFNRGKGASISQHGNTRNELVTTCMQNQNLHGLRESGRDRLVSSGYIVPWYAGWVKLNLARVKFGLVDEETTT